MLTREDVQNYIKIKEGINPLEGKISDRIDEVLHLVFKWFGAELKNWYFPDADEGQLGTMPDHELLSERGQIDFESAGINLSKAENNYWDYHYCIPSKFLFMNNVDIVHYLQKEQEDGEKKFIEKKKKVAEAKAKKELLKKAALSKLTPSEKKALGIK